MKLPQQQTKQVCVKLATYADNVALPALACCCCSNQSISPATGPTANLQQGVCWCGPMFEKNTQTDVRTPHRFIDPILHAMWAHTHTRIHLMALFPGLPGWAGTRKVKPIWILLKKETMSGSGISWDICKSATRSRQITMPAPHHSVFYRPDALPAAQPTASKHWRHAMWAVLIKRG